MLSNQHATPTSQTPHPLGRFTIMRSSYYRIVLSLVSHKQWRRQDFVTGGVRYGGLEYEVPQSRLYCLCINVALCSTALQCRVIQRSSMTMKAHTYYIIFCTSTHRGEASPWRRHWHDAYSWSTRRDFDRNLSNKNTASLTVQDSQQQYQYCLYTTQSVSVWHNWSKGGFYTVLKIDLWFW